jgi:hypothetical protein
MRVSATFTTDPKLMLRSYRACHPRAIPIRWMIGLAGIAVSVGTHSVYPAVAGLVYVSFLAASVRWQLRRYLQGARQVTVVISDDAYETTGPEGVTRSWRWSDFKALERRGEFWVLRISSMRAIAFPAMALEREQTEQFVEHMAAVGLLEKPQVSADQ